MAYEQTPKKPATMYTCAECKKKETCSMRRKTYRGGELHSETVRCSEWKHE